MQLFDCETMTIHMLRFIYVHLIASYVASNRLTTKSGETGARKPMFSRVGTLFTNTVDVIG